MTALGRSTGARRRRRRRHPRRSLPRSDEDALEVGSRPLLGLTKAELMLFYFQSFALIKQMRDERGSGDGEGQKKQKTTITARWMNE